MRKILQTGKFKCKRGDKQLPLAPTKKLLMCENCSICTQRAVELCYMCDAHTRHHYYYGNPLLFYSFEIIIIN